MLLSCVLEKAKIYHAISGVTLALHPTYAFRANHRVQHVATIDHEYCQTSVQMLSAAAYALL